MIASGSTPQPVEYAPVASRGFTGCRPVKPRHGLTLFRQPQSRLEALRCLPVERLCNCRRAAHLAEKQDLHLKVAAFVLYLQQVAEPDLAGTLGRLPI